MSPDQGVRVPDVELTSATNLWSDRKSLRCSPAHRLVNLLSRSFLRTLSISFRKADHGERYQPGSNERFQPGGPGRDRTSLSLDDRYCFCATATCATRDPRGLLPRQAWAD